MNNTSTEKLMYSNSELISLYRTWCDRKGMNRVERARFLGLSDAWGSLLEKGAIRGLRSTTRIAIMSLLGLNGDDS